MQQNEKRFHHRKCYSITNQIHGYSQVRDNVTLLRLFNSTGVDETYQ